MLEPRCLRCGGPMVEESNAKGLHLGPPLRRFYCLCCGGDRFIRIGAA